MRWCLYLYGLMRMWVRWRKNTTPGREGKVVVGRCGTALCVGCGDAKARPRRTALDWVSCSLRGIESATVAKALRGAVEKGEWTLNRESDRM